VATKAHEQSARTLRLLLRASHTYY
jgi:hypothetical protein